MIEKINTIINQFGGKKDVVFLGIFIAFFFLSSSLIRKNKLRLIFSIISSFFVILQLISLFFTQSFIGYQFFVHFNLRGIQGVSGFYTVYFFIAAILLILIAFIFYWSRFCIYKKNIFLFKNSNNSLMTKLLTLVLMFFFLSILLTKSSFISDSKSLISILHTTNTSFVEVLEKNNMSDYITPNQIESKKGKNIIVISLESVEKGFLEDKFSHLTPNLRKLKKDWNYYNVQQNEGSGWTSGSLYTYLTGFPAYFGVQGNSIFQTAYYSKISSISHALEKADYETVYMNGDANYSGVKEMLHTLHFDKIIDKHNVNINNKSHYGLRDKDLFELAKKEIEEQSLSEKPFALFISSTDTHFPNGIYDGRMEKVISKKATDLEFAVASVDYMVGDLISYLKEEELLSNTIIYIFPDHLKMGDPSTFDDTGDRSLYLISNAKKEELSIDTTQTLYQIDLPKIILNGAEVKHNLKFLTDYILEDKEVFLENNILSITELNTNGFMRYNTQLIDLSNVSSRYGEYKKDTMRYIAHAGGKIDGFTYTNSKEALDLQYEKGFRLFELDILLTKDGKYVAAHDWELWAEITGYKGTLPVTHEEFLKHKIHNRFTPLDMSDINEWFSLHKDAILVTDKVNDPIKFSKKFIYPDRLIMELFDMDAVKLGLKANIKSAMPSQSIISNITRSEIKYLKKIGVKNIAISRRFISDNIELLNEFIKNDIRPYAFHINFETGFDEDYVTKYEMDHIYGIYADEWDFN